MPLHTLAGVLGAHAQPPRESMEEPITWAEWPQFMADVRAMAHGRLAHESREQSLQTTALVVTALRWQRLASQDWSTVTWQNRRYMVGAFYLAMERALADRGRRRAAQMLTLSEKTIRRWWERARLLHDEILRILLEEA